MLATGPARAEVVRVVVWNVELSRRGPGLLLRDILSGQDAQVAAVVAVIAELAPDVLLLSRLDWDHDLQALGALADRLAAVGVRLDHRLAFRPNTGWQTGIDLDGDGRLGTPDDAQGYGAFAGAGGMALLSRLPVIEEAARDFSGFLWRDLPGSLIPLQDGRPFPSARAHGVQRLSSTGHWDVPLALPDGGRLHILAYHAGPPVFGGPMERNLRRNHDETLFWARLLDGVLPMPPPEAPFVLVGDANLDPLDGDGMHEAIRAVLAHPALQDPQPRSAGAVAAAAENPRNAGHRGDAGLHTVNWTQPRGPGNLRVVYALPAAELEVVGAGVFWPAPEDPLHALVAEDVASRHRPVWLDLRLPGGPAPP